jgi:hypothetical protein
MTGTCLLCERDDLKLTRHHVVPKARHNKKVKRELGAKRNKTEWVCRPCHSQLHRLYTEKQLEREFNTIELLKAQPDVQTWIAWICKHPNIGKEMYTWKRS